MRSETSIPCLVCGKPLERVSDDYEAQPDDGTMFEAKGNYGSTVFDPEDGSYLLVLICDGCLTTAGAQQRVLTGRDRMPVTTDVPTTLDGKMRTYTGTIGWQKINRPLIPWHADLASDDAKCHIPIEELASYLDDKRFEWNLSHAQLLTMIAEVESYDSGPTKGA